MKTKSLKLMTLAALVTSIGMVGCKKEAELITDSAALPCDYFTQDRVLQDNPDVDVDYVIGCDMIVSADITVMPGTKIEFKTDAGIQVLETGSFNAVGTQVQPILMSGVDQTPGSWRGIYIDSNDSKNKFEHCAITYAGGTAHNSNGDQGTFVLWANSKVEIKNCVITTGGSDGINAVYSGADIRLSDNTISGNQGAPMRIDPSYLGVPNATDTYADNLENYILVVPYTQDIDEVLTWKKVDVDYKVTGAGTIYIAKPVTIEPGVHVYFDADCDMFIREEGSLSAIGTASDKIVFRGVTPVAGSWGGIYFQFTSSVLNVISHAEIAHAGNSNFDGAVYMWAEPTVTVTNVDFSDLGSCAFFAGGAADGNPNLTQNNNTFVSVPQVLCED